MRPPFWPFRSRWVVAGAALAVVIVLGFVVWRLDQPVSTPSASASAQAPPASTATPAPAPPRCPIVSTGGSMRAHSALSS